MRIICTLSIWLAAANHIDNVQIIRMAAEEFTQAMNGVRQFNRLQGIDLHSYQCETIFVDVQHRRACGVPGYRF